MRTGAALFAIGAAIGLVAAIASVRVLATLLYNVRPFDLVSFGTAVSILLLVALAACYLPARRAARVDPTLALRAARRRAHGPGARDGDDRVTAVHGPTQSVDHDLRLRKPACANRALPDQPGGAVGGRPGFRHADGVRARGEIDDHAGALLQDQEEKRGDAAPFIRQGH